MRGAQPLPWKGHQHLGWPETTAAFAEAGHRLPSRVLVPLLLERTGLCSIFNEKGKHFLSEEVIQPSCSITAGWGGFMSELPAQPLMGFQKISAGIFAPG